MPVPSAAASRFAPLGAAAVQVGHRVRYFTAVGDLIRVVGYVSVCRRLPLHECPCIPFTGQTPGGGCQTVLTWLLEQEGSTGEDAAIH